MDLVNQLLAGDRRALARAISLVENNSANGEEVLAVLFAHTGHAHTIGITGAPGTGKSSLVSQLASHLRTGGATVGIVAVDPTSPFSGGAILGDRIRMHDLAGDPGVFIRSMASRGSLGGLARTTADVVKVLDAAGFDIILIETVGAGQSEVNIAQHADTVTVVEAPGLGDDVQAIKAGLLEIADVLVVNKADDPRAENTFRTLRAMLELAGHGPDYRTAVHHGHLLPPELLSSNSDEKWQVPIYKTVALSGEGVPDLAHALHEHHAYLKRSGEGSRRAHMRVVAELDNLLREALLDRLLACVDQDRLEMLIERVWKRELEPHEAVNTLVTAGTD